MGALLGDKILDKPADVFDRDAEWADLADFALSPLPGLRIAVVYGRRRQGKSYLLRRLTGAVGGLYHLATEQAEPVSLRRFGDSLAAWAGLTAGPVGQTVIACREHKAGHEIDILALARGSRPRTPGTPVAFVCAAKHRDRRPGLAELRRLHHLRDLLTAAGHDASDAVLGLFSAAGFTDDLAAEATASGGTILLATLDGLYGQPS